MKKTMVILLIGIWMSMACETRPPAEKKGPSPTDKVNVPDTATSRRSIDALMDSAHKRFQRLDTAAFPKLFADGFLYYATFADEDEGYYNKDSIINSLKEELAIGSKELPYKYHVHKRVITIAKNGTDAGVFEHVTVNKDPKDTEDDLRIFYHLRYVNDRWLIDLLLFNDSGY